MSIAATARRCCAPIVYTCEWCGAPIGDNTGAVFVRGTDVRAYEQAKCEWEERRPPDGNGWRILAASDLLEHPAAARWQAAHNACDPDPDDGSFYWFDVSRARTHAQLLDWTAHLMGKRWLDATDWPYFVRRVALKGIDA